MTPADRDRKNGAGSLYSGGMRVVFLWAVTLAVLGSACQSNAGSSSKPAPVGSAVGPVRPDTQKFGGKIESKAEAPLTRVLANPGEYQGKTVVVEGTVRRACSRKGCWMELSSSKDPAAPGCRVTFKDYGFFVPLDSAGSSARVEAAVEVAQLKPAYVAHMEQEGAHFAKKEADGSAQEVRLVATGVELWR